MNSSPPNRPSMSRSRTTDRSRSLITRSSSSPTAWPRLSLITLKLSRSMNSTAIEPELGSVEPAAQLFEEVGPVRQARQLVVARRPLQVGGGLALIGDVLDVDDRDARDRSGPPSFRLTVCAHTTWPSCADEALLVDGECRHGSSTDDGSAARRRVGELANGTPISSLAFVAEHLGERVVHIDQGEVVRRTPSPCRSAPSGTRARSGSAPAPVGSPGRFAW